MNKYKDKIICRGSILLNSGCMTCDKCKDELNKLKEERLKGKDDLKRINKIIVDSIKNTQFTLSDFTSKLKDLAYMELTIEEIKKMYEQYTSLNKEDGENIKKDKFYNFGWICPVCGRGNAPFTKTCICVPIDNKITYKG